MTEQTYPLYQRSRTKSGAWLHYDTKIMPPASGVTIMCANDSRDSDLQISFDEGKTIGGDILPGEQITLEHRRETKIWVCAGMNIVEFRLWMW